MPIFFSISGAGRTRDRRTTRTPGIASLRSFRAYPPNSFTSNQSSTVLRISVTESRLTIMAIV